MLRALYLALALVFAAMANRAQADFMVFTDRTEFLNAAANAGLTTTNENFTSPGPGDPFAIDDLSGNSVEFDILDGSFGADAISGGIGDVKLKSTSVTGTVVGIGFDTIYVFGGGHSSLQQLLLNDGSAEIKTFGNSGNSVSFLGLLSTDGMLVTSVDDITVEYEPTNHYSRLDNLVIVTGNVEQVPEPSTLALLGMGGLGMCGYRWRRKRKTQSAA